MLPILAAMAAACAGCGAPAGDAQVAAKVGQAEISTFQVAEALRRRADLAGLPPDAARRAALDTLVEQEIAAQAARAEGLDKDPATIQAMELVKREFLARAYQDRLAGRLPPPTPQAIEQFYAANPARFAERKLYVLQEYAIEAGPGIAEPSRLADGVEQLAEGAASPEALSSRLHLAGTRFSTRRLAKAPEELTAAQLDALRALAPGKALVSRHAAYVMVYWLVRAEPAPLDRISAAPLITAALLERQRSAHVEERMQAWRRQLPVALPPAAAAPASAVTAMR